MVKYEFNMLRVIEGKIISEDGKPVRLKGIALGGWLMMEGYILGGRNIPESIFKSRLAKIYSKKFVKEFTKRFRNNFIQISDYITIKRLGFNCVRLPFNYRLLEEPDGLDYLKQTVKKISKQELYVILDMHAVPGSQNQDWHSDSSGEASFWSKQKYRKKYLLLWEKLAKTFKDYPFIAGYDIMNEPVAPKINLLLKVYQETINIIRRGGDQHIIFLEGNKWAREVDFLKDIKGNNLGLSIHFYEPVEFAFNWLPDAKYPGEILGKRWNRKAIKKFLKRYADFAKTLKMPIFVGEFGVASRCNYCHGEFRWLKDVLPAFEEFGFHWTYWTYKSVKGVDLPDGLFQLTDATGIIGIKSISSGMEKFYSILKSRKEEFFRIWQTRNFKLNKFLYQLILNRGLSKTKMV